MVCTIESIQKRMDDKINEASEMLGLSEDDAIQVLRYFKWNQDKLQNEWFAKEKQLRLQAGIEFDKNIVLKNPQINTSLSSKNQGYCMICYSMFSNSNSNMKPVSLSCGHQFCTADWIQYLKQRIANSATALSTKCPQFACNLMVPHSVFASMLQGQDLVTYRKWACKSYTDDNKNVRWCPFQGCDYCVEYQDMGVQDVLCKCGNWYCFKCGDESHAPCTCE